MNTKRILQLLMACLLVLAMAACTKKKTEDNDATGTAGTTSTAGATNETGTVYPLTITDREGITTTLPKVPERIVSISPAITETVAALGRLDALVGRTTFCDYPAGVSAVADIGELYEPNIEAIIALEPDVILLSAHTNPSVPQALRDAGMKVIRIYGDESFDGAYEMVRTVAEILDTSAQAETLVSNMQAKIADIESKVKDLPAKTVYYCVSAGEFGDYTATGDTYVDAMLEKAGGINIAKDATGWAYSLEQLIEKDPEVIIASELAGYKALLPNMAGYQDLTAVKNGNVIEIDTNPIDRIGPRFADGLELLARAIHPEAFK